MAAEGNDAVKAKERVFEDNYSPYPKLQRKILYPVGTFQSEIRSH